jgi:putative flavoprotein involved in K+ transport
LRWIGHTLHADADVTVPADLPLVEGHNIAHHAEDHLLKQLPRLSEVRWEPDDEVPDVAAPTADVTNVIWCTGFAQGLTWIDLPVFNQDGDLVHDRGIVTSEPGLYFIGMYFQYALSSVLIGGFGRDAEHVARHIEASQPVRRPEHTRR